MWLASISIVPGWWLLVNSAVVLAAVLLERRGYDPKASHPEALQPTGERFRDPTTDQMIEVWEDPQTGTREYRPTSHV
jgi:hypothetical protein